MVFSCWGSKLKFFVVTCVYVCVFMYMYAHNGSLREKILIKQEHPRLSITKTILITGIFSGYMLENIKNPQLLLCKGLH